jgi:hypothetical protein
MQEDVRAVLQRSAIVSQASPGLLGRDRSALRRELVPIMDGVIGGWEGSPRASAFIKPAMMDAIFRGGSPVLASLLLDDWGRSLRDAKEILRRLGVVLPEGMELVVHGDGRLMPYAGKKSVSDASGKKRKEPGGERGGKLSGIPKHADGKKSVVRNTTCRLLSDVGADDDPAASACPSLDYERAGLGARSRVPIFRVDGTSVSASGEVQRPFAREALLHGSVQGGPADILISVTDVVIGPPELCMYRKAIQLSSSERVGVPPALDAPEFDAHSFIFGGKSTGTQWSRDMAIKGRCSGSWGDVWLGGAHPCPYHSFRLCGLSLSGAAGARTNKRQTAEFKLWAAEQLEENGLNEDEAIVELEALLQDAKQRVAAADEAGDEDAAARGDFEYYTMLRNGMIQDNKRLGEQCRVFSLGEWGG